jgi:hypothetical protein
VWAPLLLIGAAFEVRTQRRLRQEGIRVQGKVVRHEQDPDSESRNVYFPIVAFASADGQTHECRTSYSGRRRFPIGQTMPVLYLPESPRTCVIDTRAQRWSKAGLLVLLGGVFATVCAVLLLGR